MVRVNFLLLGMFLLPAMMLGQGSVDNRYHWEVGASGGYNLMYNEPLPFGEQGSYGLDGVYSFRELAHDEITRTTASRAVLPKSWVSVAGQIGPEYPGSPDVFVTNLAGAWLATRTIGIGAAFTLHQQSWNITDHAPSRPTQYALELNDYTYAIFLDIYASSGVMLRELIGTGKQEYRIDGKLIDDRSVTRYEHHLAATGGEDIGYSHELILTSYEDDDPRAMFNHYVEIAPSPHYAFIPQLRMNAVFPRSSKTLFSFGIGCGVQYNFTPRIFMQATPVYYPERDDLSGKEFDFYARFGVRF
ncbi:MAG: hypothetical protein WBQ23_16940 [Bacteroidota bacterium]